ncbi:MAG: hypothetical protein RIQ79_531, partial [Verrucomicrobiota bacterium]
AEVKINENLSLDGYAIGSGVITEGTPPGNYQLVNTGRVFDSIKVALNGKYQDFSAKVSLIALDSVNNAVPNDAGLLDAYVTYKIENLSITGGKYLGWLGYESFDSPNNAFISFSQVIYSSPYATGVKLDYAGDGFSTGFSVRDSQTGPGGAFFEGDGEFSDDLGYEAYISYTGIKDLTLFAGAGYEDVDTGDDVLTTDFWAAYKVTEKLTLAGEYATTEDATTSSWLALASYAVSDELSVAGRITGLNGRSTDAFTSDAIAYGVAGTYTFTPNFSLKGEVTITDPNGGAPDVAQYALQGLFRF